MFANYDSGKTVTNLAEWKVNSTGGSEGNNGVIQEDIADNKLNGNNDTDTKWDSTTGNTTEKIVDSNTTSATLTHNGVKWTYSNPSASSTGRDGNGTTDNAITITGQVNIYKAMNGSTGYQTAFKTKEGGCEFLFFICFTDLVYI